MGHDSMTDVQLDVDRGEQKLIVCLSSGQEAKMIHAGVEPATSSE